MKTVIKKVDARLNGRCYIPIDGYLGDDSDLITSSGQLKVFDSFKDAAFMADDLCRFYPGTRWVIELA